MKSVLALCAFVLTTVAAAPAADGDYDDPGMHYSPPPGWEKIATSAQPGQDAPSESDDDENRPPAAVYAYHRGQSDQRIITITIHNFDGPLDSFDSAHESDVRKNGDSTFLDKPIKTTLANGMPVDLLKITSGSDAGHFRLTYEYLMIDGTRSIDVAYSGRQGDFNKDDAVAAFSSLYVVAYPRHRP